MDHCCKDLGIQLVPGQHCPRQADTLRVLKVSSQSSSTVSTAEGIGPHRPFVYSFKKKFLTEWIIIIPVTPVRIGYAHSPTIGHVLNKF